MLSRTTDGRLHIAWSLTHGEQRGLMFDRSVPYLSSARIGMMVPSHNFSLHHSPQFSCRS
jgi:hypothetical protein